MDIKEFSEEELKEMRDLAFNSEVNLLSIHILFEAFHRGENILTLEEFMKGDYWKIEEIYEAVRESNDYGSVPDLVLEQLNITIELFNVAHIKKVSVVHLSGFLETMIEEALETDIDKSGDRQGLIDHFCAVISRIGELKALSDKQKEEAFQAGEYSTEKWSYHYDRVDFEPDKYSKELEYIIQVGASFIEFEIEFFKEGVGKLEAALEDYLVSFSQDDFLEEKENRLYFSTQLENFLAYINKRPVINGYVNVPFEVLSEKGFEFIKITSYLENQHKLKVRNWGDKSIWNIKFHKTPITVDSLVSSDQTGEVSTEIASLKSDLSFSTEKGLLKIGDKEAYFRKDTVPYHLIRIIFGDNSELEKEWFYSEIGEKYDSSGTFDDKKFSNAAYQAKQRIIRDTGIKDFLITTKQSVTINPKYLG